MRLLQLATGPDELFAGHPSSPLLPDDRAAFTGLPVVGPRAVIPMAPHVLVRREDFRIVEFSVQDNHVHLIVEAET